MAIVQNQAVPSSLAATFSALLNSSNPAPGGSSVVSVNPSAINPTAQVPATHTLEFVSRAAQWLTDKYALSLSTAARSAFYAARRAEMLAGTFDPTWWESGALIGDYVQRAVPTTFPYNDPIPPEYNDPLRQPTSASYKHYSNQYLYTAADGTDTQPFPGWRGQVIAGKFYDIYHAQRSLRYRFTRNIEKNDDTPIAVYMTITISAVATLRGNRLWFTPNTWIKPFWSDVSQSSSDTINSWWKPAQRWAGNMPAENPAGWTHIVDRIELFDGQGPLDWEFLSSGNGLELRIITAPARGKYFARNDQVEVHHTISCGCYLAK